ncbi:hypothetical protein PSTT_13303 [Puccinia striiformis]|uniref:DNA 3'-5' helicase n=1 Tax=Puccinia striiformis TaxID=27350 RepID=A0A2S4USU0_9BASI|nr:hypothetical protein PSTT_13303 [Puccinia striiformis]
MNRISKNPPPPVNRPQATWASGGITVVQKILKKKDASLRNEIMEISRYRYQQDAKPLQIDAVVNLVRGRNTFLLAGTGYGKSRIPELYFRTLPIRERPVVVILNPLDTLGDNQVLEKKDTKFTAINLTKLTFNPKEADKILNGEYNFVYLSPEIFLNSKMWDRIYFSNKFQRRLGLVVVDEAHMVYEWGIIKKTRGRKRSSALGRHEDRGIFRPSYGNLGGHLMTRNNMPILLMSATCRPVAIEAIKKSLKLPDKTLVMLRGNSHWLSAPDDQSLEVLDKARGSGDAAEDPDSTFARRFHSITGNLGKVDVAEDFGAGKFPIVSATMALGLGQNWSRVRSVIHMGRGDPAAICQMLGRCGRDGRPGVAIMFVEKTRVGGKNQIHQILDGFEQSDDDRMDGLAITPVCLRIAFSLDTKLGYIPMSFKDSGYLKEKAREESEGFPQLAKRKKIKTRTPRPSTKRALADPEDLRLYKKRMRSTVHELYLRYHGENSFWTADQLFPDKKMDLIAHHADNLANVQQLEILIGGETIEGQLDALMELTIGFQRRIIPVPVPKKSAVAIRAEAATKAIAERASLPTQKTATKPRRSNRISLP